MRPLSELFRSAILVGLIAVTPAACAAEEAEEATTTTAAVETTTVPDPTTTVPPAEPASLGLELVTDRIAAPKGLVDIGEGRLLVSDQQGSVWLIEDGVLSDEPLLDLGERVLGPGANAPELGLAGLAAAPDFAASGRFYVFYTAPPENPGEQRIDTLAEWTVAADDPRAVDPDSERILLTQPLPNRDHVGDIIFDSAGMLLVGFGARTNDTEAQDPTSFAGSILRIDVDGDPYAIPDDNPFVGGDNGALEVFSYGYRNPFRFSHDSEWGVVVSLPMFREKNQQVNVVSPGDNAGYPDTARIVSTCFEDGGVVPECLATAAGDPVVAPVFEYGPDVGQIVSGAVIYRGSDLPELDGMALISDWRGNLVVATPGTEAPWPYVRVDLDLPPGQASDLLWGLRVDSRGEVYVMTTSVSLTSGAVYRLTSG